MQPAQASATARISRQLTIPASFHAPTLAFAYQLGGATPANGSRVDVLVTTTDLSTTTVLSLTESTPWREAWVDMSPWQGQPITLTFALEQAEYAPPAVFYVDDVSLGSWHTPLLYDVRPTRVAASTAATLTIGGANFIATPQVLLNDQPLSGVVRVDGQTLRVALPPQSRPGQIELRVVNPGGQRSQVARLNVGEALYLPLLRR